jgi:hypothetical protein
MIIIKIISALLTIGLFMWIIVLRRRTKQLWKGKSLGEHAAAFKQAQHLMPSDEAEKRWKEIEDHTVSQNPSDWKLAIINADALVDDILKRAGYAGKGLGERLKQIEPSDLDHLPDLWEAHKLRNRIAHEAEALNRRDVDRAMYQYRAVLKELKFL